MAWIGAQPLTKAVFDIKDFTATEGQTTFNLSYNPHFLIVTVNGIEVRRNIDYIADNGTSVEFTTALSAGDEVGFKIFNTFNPVDTYKKSEVDSLDAENVKLTGDQSIDGVKTFTSSPTAPTPAVGTNNTQLATTAFVTANSFGAGQVWQDVTASRIFDITYTNTTGKPIEVLFIGASNATYTINVGLPFSYTQSSSNLPICFTIPNGISYWISHSGSGEIRHWMELR